MELKMNDIYKVLKYIKEYIEDPKVIKDPMLQKIYVGAAAKANKLSKKHGTHYVLSALKEFEQNVKYYFAASSEMFGKVREIPQTENTPFHPRSAYGISKVTGFELKSKVNKK